MDLEKQDLYHLYIYKPIRQDFARYDNIVPDGVSYFICRAWWLETQPSKPNLNGKIHSDLETDKYHANHFQMILVKVEHNQAKMQL